MRIASLAPSNTEILYAIGAQDELVCTTTYCDYPSEAKEKPKVGGWLNTNPAKLREFSPDVVLTSNFLQDNLVRVLRGQGLTVAHVDPRTLQQVLSSFLEIGRAVGRLNEALELASRVREDIEGTVRRSLKAKRTPRVYVEEWGSQPTVSGNWVPDIVKASGGTSMIESGYVSRSVSAEEVVAFDPVFMIVSWCGYGQNVSVEDVRGRKGWEKLRARVHVMDDSLLNRPGPRLAEGARTLQELLRL